MYSTLNILSERVIRDLSGGDIPMESPYDQSHVIEHVRDAMNEELKREILVRRGGDSDDKSAISQYIYTYQNIQVKRDITTRRTYAELPSYFLSLKYNKGIHSVSTMTDSLNRMIRIANPGVTSKLPHADLEKVNFGYYVEGMTVFWMRDILQERISSVMIKLLIAAPITLGIDDPLPLTPESLGRILDVAKARVQARTPQDRIADEDPNLRQVNESRK